LSEFRCEMCGKRFRWKAELAGRDVRCPCGNVQRCPVEEGADEAMYDFAPQVTKSETEAEAAIKPSVPTLDYRTPPQGKVAASGGLVDIETLKNQHIPLWLLGGGVVIESFAAFLVYGSDLPRIMTHIFVEIVGGTALMLVGVMLAAKIRGIQVGSFRSAILKLAAISVAPAAVGDLLFPAAVFIPFLGWILVLIVQFVLYFALLGALFDLEESDTWYFVKVIFLIDLAVFALMHWVPWHH
jgi:hypothetical protein